MRYMILAVFDKHDEAAFQAAVPNEQAHVEQLKEQGTIEAQYFALDRSKGWMIMQGESQAHVEQALQSLPLFPYMHIELTPLAE